MTRLNRRFNREEALETSRIMDEVLKDYYCGRDDDFWNREDTWNKE